MTANAPQQPEMPLNDLIACPHCDVLHRAGPLHDGERARCSRCGTLLIAPRERSFLQVIALSLTVAILMIGAVFFPFLGVSTAGLSNDSSVFDVALAFSVGILGPLALLVIALIVFVPLLRVVMLVYALWPLAQDRPAYRHAAQALRLAERLKPWSMAEVFVIGTSVALVKVAGLAHVSLGPAFWAFCALVIVVMLNDNVMCKWTIWKALETNRNS